MSKMLCKEKVKSVQEHHCLPASRLVVPMGSSISEASQQERAEGIREVGLGRDYRHEQSRARQQKRSMERRIQRG